MPQVFVDGKLVDPAEASISVFDHGLLVGDGVFETILVHRGQPFTLTRHLNRLTRSASGLGLPPVDLDTIREGIAAVVASCEEPEARLRVTVTAGRGPLRSGRVLVPGGVIIACEPVDQHHPTTRVATVPWPRNERGAVAGLKTTSYAENALALAWVMARDADEAVFSNTVDELCEGSGSNVFVVFEGELVTPPLSSGCLAGVTRELILERFGAVEQRLPISAFRAGLLDEAFLTSTVLGARPITMIDGEALASAPGPITIEVANYLDELIDTVPDP